MSLAVVLQRGAGLSRLDLDDANVAELIMAETKAGVQPLGVMLCRPPFCIFIGKLIECDGCAITAVE
jgi:hypothetical protein